MWQRSEYEANLETQEIGLNFIFGEKSIGVQLEIESGTFWILVGHSYHWATENSDKIYLNVHKLDPNSSLKFVISTHYLYLSILHLWLQLKHNTFNLATVPNSELSALSAINKIAGYL